MSRTPNVRTGLDVLCAQDFAPLRGMRIGLVTHAAAVDSRLRSALELFLHAPQIKVVALFGPEHGFTGSAQDLAAVATADDPVTGLRIHSLYGDTFDSLRPRPEHLEGLDALVIDLVDVGSRYYTFQGTTLLCMEAASLFGVRTVILDRPNPLGGEEIEGPHLCPGFESFVGLHAIQTRHGMTVGELAQMYHLERGLTKELDVICCEGWRRGDAYDATGLPWVLPSPNMPTLDTAFVYPGQCLLEGTNLSEGRGTCRPFELCGAPWIEPRALAARMNKASLPGVEFRPVSFIPTFNKWVGQSCGGVQLHILDRVAFRPVRTSLHLLQAFRELSGPKFEWRKEKYEFVTDRLAIDLLFGSNRERKLIEKDMPADEIATHWEAEEEAFRVRRKAFLLY